MYLVLGLFLNDGKRRTVGAPWLLTAAQPSSDALTTSADEATTFRREEIGGGVLQSAVEILDAAGRLTRWTETHGMLL